MSDHRFVSCKLSVLGIEAEDKQVPIPESRVITVEHLKGSYFVEPYLDNGPIQHLLSFREGPEFFGPRRFGH
jgi:hypothetical protein